MIGGQEIAKQIELGNITTTPYCKEQIGPNSYDLRLGNKIDEVMPNVGIAYIDTHLQGNVKEIKQNEDGSFTLFPNCYYLGFTLETVGSKYYVPILHGRSTAARHGLMVHASAGFGDINWFGQFVLELKNLTSVPMKIWPGDRICQVSWEHCLVDEEYQYKSTYQGQSGIVAAKGLGD